MEREHATRDFEAILARIAELDVKAGLARRKRTREFFILLALPFIFIIAACAVLEARFEQTDRINQETASHD